ncbi:hypothetical protein EMIT043CA1_290047 [Pseudomonas brassicacearum]
MYDRESQVGYQAASRRAHGAMPSFGHAEPKRGTEWWGKPFLLTFFGV